MSVTWYSAEPPEPPAALGLVEKARVIRRVAPLATLIAICFVALILVRLIERPLFGLRRPLTPYISRFVCHSAFWIMALPIKREGQPMAHRGAIVANHSSWLDIFALNAFENVYFVSKSEVSDWPGIGWLARATGTVFIRRNRVEARYHADSIYDRFRAGHLIVLFPEGTSTDGQRILPFKSTLFQAFLAADVPDNLHIQPVTVIYQSPPETDPRFYAWWGDMGFGAHLVKLLSVARQGQVRVRFHTPIRVDDIPNRKALAQRCEQTVRDGLSDAKDPHNDQVVGL